jgi:hypothetical protein
MAHQDLVSLNGLLHRYAYTEYIRRATVCDAHVTPILRHGQAQTPEHAPHLFPSLTVDDEPMSQ